MLFLALCASFFSMNGTGQTKKVDVDNVYFEYSHRKFPTEPQDPPYYTYGVTVHLSRVAEEHISPDEVWDAMQIEGEERVDDPKDGVLNIDLNLGSVMIAGTRMMPTVDVGSKASSYAMRVEYSFECFYTLRRGETILRDRSLSRSEDKHYYSSNEYKTRKEASDWWFNNREAIISDIYRHAYLNAAARATKVLSEHYGFAVKKESALFFTPVVCTLKTIDEEKHDENETFRQTTDKLKELLSSVTAVKPVDEAAAAPLISYYEGIPAKYADAKLKADIRLRYAAYFNLCQLYYLMDKPDEVIRYADLIVANGYNEKDGERFNKMATEMKTEFERVKVYSTHFDAPAYFGSGEREEVVN